MRTAPSNCRYGRRGLRLAAALLPLPGLAVPATAHAAGPVTIAICSGDGAREIAVPARDAPPPRPDDRQVCAHLVCPRERGCSGPADDDED